MRQVDTQLRDLCRLAVERTENAVGSVTQLAESAPQAYAIGVGVTCALVRGAAKMVQDGLEHETGERPPEEFALYHVIGHLLDGLGLEWKTQSNSRTRSRKK